MKKAITDLTLDMENSNKDTTKTQVNTILTT